MAFLQLWVQRFRGWIYIVPYSILYSLRYKYLVVIKYAFVIMMRYYISNDIIHWINSDYILYCDRILTIQIQFILIWAVLIRRRIICHTPLAFPIRTRNIRVLWCFCLYFWTIHDRWSERVHTTYGVFKESHYQYLRLRGIYCWRASINLRSGVIQRLPPSAEVTNSTERGQSSSFLTSPLTTFNLSHTNCAIAIT